VRPIRVLFAVSAAAVLAAACGGSSDTPAASGSGTASAASPSGSASSSSSDGSTASLSATEILAKAQAARKAAPSVHLKGSGSSEGETFEIDMRYGSGQKAIGTITSSGKQIELRRNGKTVYMKADASFWQSTAGAEAAKLLAGKYLKAPLTDQRVAALATFTDKDSFTSEVLKPDGTVTKGDTKSIRGTQAVGLRSSGSSGGGTLYIASEGEALPLQLVPDKGGKDVGQLDFLDYGQPVKVDEPPMSQVIDVSKLGG
jgi:hypothetical protein